MEDAEPSADTSAKLAAKVAGPGTVVAPGTPTFVTAVAPTFATAGTPATAAQQPLVRFDAEMAAVRAAVEKVVVELVTGTRSSSDIKRALLSHAHQLGLFFGRRGINDLLLPLLITCLNATEWQLRSSFFGAIAAVGPHTGGGTLGVFLLPCLEQVRWAGAAPTAACQVAVVCVTGRGRGGAVVYGTLGLAHNQLHMQEHMCHAGAHVS